MKRYLLSIILGFLTMTNFSYGQVGINFAEETADANGTVDIDITANGFTNISVLQFSAGWDSLVMTFNSVTFTNPALIDLLPGNIGSPMGSANVDEGQFSFSYGNPNGNGNLNDGDVLFTVRFNVVGEECDETTIEMTGDPTPIDAYDNNFNQLTVTPISGSMLINGPDCGSTNEDDLTFIGAMVTADMGTNICIPITVENFIAIQTGTGTILWDPTVISYTGLANIALSGLGGSLNETGTDDGELKFIWSNPDPGNPVTLVDGSTVFEICFDVIGDVGDMSPITLSTQGSLGFEWGNDDVNELPLDLTDGKLTVTETIGDPFILNVSNYIAGDNEANACVNISIQNFNDVLGMQFVITWDETILTNATPSNFNLEGLSISNFNIDGNCATMSWNVNTGFNLADDTDIFSMCFDVIGPCDSSSAVDLVSKGSTDIEILDGNTMPIPYSVNAGSITVDCVVEPTCDIVNIDKTCVGTLGGNVTVDVPTTNCTYSWANSSGTEVSTDKNLLGVAAGTYILTVTCDGAETCTLSATVDNYPELVIDDGNPMNAACGDKGSLNVTVSFGSGNYSYNWNPAQADSPNISELDPGTYQLTVTDDDNGCTQTAEYDIIDEVETLVITSSQVIDETCLESNGRISLTIDGGCQPYTFEWSDLDIGNTPIAADLTAGSYQVTVSDNSSPKNTAIGSYTVDGTDPITQVGSADITPSSGSNGSITIEVTGGEPDYSYNWSGPTSGLPNSNSISGLIDGTYDVTITDSNGCMDTLGPFVVPFIIVVDIDSVIVEGIQAMNDANGFSVKCNGDMNGVIKGTITAGDMPYTIELSGDESRTIELNDAGTFSIDSLTAGTYNVTVSNDINSVSTPMPIIISEPEPLLSSVEQGCDSEEQCDGFIDLNITGGVGALSVNWGDPDLSGESLNDLCEGSYTAITTDENGCVRMDAVTIESCDSIPNIDCYQVRDVITPNGDGMNDQFTVTCISDFPASLEVFDRWGKLVFSQDAYDGTWVGISNSNEELIEGGYMYIINIDFGQGRREIMKGTITLLRD